MSSKREFEEQEENPFDTANSFSRTIFWWLLPFIKKGFTQELKLTDLYQTPSEDLSKDLGQRLKRRWDEELYRRRDGHKPSLVRALCRTFGLWYVLSGIWVAFGECIVRPLQAISLGWLIRDANLYLSLDGKTSKEDLNQVYWHVFYDGLVLIFFSIVALVTVHPYTFYTQHTGMKVRVACCHLIYRHALKLSNAATGQTTIGQMVNLLTNDVNRFDVALNYIQYLVVAPIQAVIAVCILSSAYLGFYATAAGSALLLLYIPFQSLMGRLFGRLRAATATRTDERIRLMNEIIPAMRVIKMYTWEDPFAKLVELARKREVQLIKYTSVLRSINMALFFVSSKIILFISFITYVLLGYVLDPEIVFVAVTLFNAVRLLMTLFFPYGVAQLAETLISCSRLQEFLELPVRELSRGTQRSRPDELVPRDKIVVDSLDVSANWTIINKVFASQDQAKSNNSNPKVIEDRKPALSTCSLGGRSVSKHSLFASSTNVHLNSAYKLAEQLVGGDGQQETAIIALRNITYQVRAGELMIIVGRVGSGKSSVLLSILGELPLASGRLQVQGRVSYAAQEAWIFAGSVRENVLFGKSFDETRYKQVLRVCSLDRDVRLFPQGDQTIVGERGVSLSGGQRARINLARAIYYQADIYLLDDPLSAVDSVVAKHIFKHCISGFLKDKAVILATHQTQFINKDTKVLFLRDGSQISCKSYSDNKELQLFIGSNWDKQDDLSNLKSRSSRMMSAVEGRKSRVAETADGASKLAPLDPEKQALLEETSSQADGSNKLSSANSAATSGSSSASDDETSSSIGKRSQQAAEAPVSRYNAESAGPLKSDGSTYIYYIKACSSCLLVSLVALSNVGTQALFNGSDFWLSYWTDTAQRKAASANETDFEPQTLTDTLTLNQNALVYTILIGSLFLLTLVRTTCFFLACMRASINLHNRLFNSVLRAPIKFFDYNPIGILLNRVSRDMGIVDDLLPPTAFDTIEIFINVLGILATIAIIYPINVIPAILLCAVVATVRLLYMRTVRSIKSIEGVTRSPVFSHLSTSLSGLATIRAFQVESDFEVKFDKYQDVHSSAWFLFIASSRWLGISLDWLSVAYISIITLVMTLTIGTSTSSQIGLAISSALFLSGSFQWGVRQSTELESHMTSVSRIKEYSELPEEPARESAAGCKPAPSWPDRGQIEFSAVNLRYFDNEEPVLRNLTFKVEAGEKIGIVGRTGAGKSSIIAVLFRLTEPEGHIYIDGLDTKTIGLHDLRKKLSIIPQEPILFNGSIRRNLDPFSEYGDLDLWLALEQVKLKELVRCLPGALDAELKEGGSNFSVGERQLVCLARAVLRQNRIIVLDEATANVDPDTDKFIQRTISESFTNCTRLTIAHRLNTVMDSDRLLVLDAGEVKEFDVPYLLLQNEDGYLSTMVRNAGKSEGELRKIAKECYEKRFGSITESSKDLMM